jgi:signal transduction histidine kinase/CheY-like chemotaxis protein/CHASE3 domain sensor protein
MGFLIAVIAVIVIALLSYESLLTTTDSARKLTKTVEVLAHLQTFMSTLKDAETGQRGYLLTGRESYLEPYSGAALAMSGELAAMRRLTADEPGLRERLDTLQLLAGEKMQELKETIELRRAGNADAALKIVMSDRGKNAMDRLRIIVSDIEGAQRQSIAAHTAAWRQAASVAFGVTGGGSALLLILIGLAAAVASRDFKARQLESWLRSGQIGLSAQMQGDQPLERLGGNMLGFLAEFLDAQVGALFIAEPGRFRRIAAYALASGGDGAALRPGDGLTGQAAKDDRVLHVRQVPAGYLPIVSGTGRGEPAELLILPAALDGTVHAVVELGFFGPVHADKQELLMRVRESMAVAIRAAKDRNQLEDLLQETQQQAEELQTREEELRVNNEELEEQGRTLRESRAQLESQQAELEQINARLEEQTQVLEHQKESLAKSHAVLTAKSGELQRANEYKSEFLANMSHELRTPLNSTLILAKLLADNKDGNLTEQQVKFARTISSAGNDLLMLINDVLDLSRIEAGKIDIETKPVQLAQLVDSLSDVFRAAAEQKGLRFTAAVAPDVVAEIETDPQRLGQILKNLLSNALKFTERGEIELRVHTAPRGAVAFSVRDTGVGIAPHQQEVIFEAFRQADGSIHRKYGGTGLGLSISRDLARLLGGSIAVKSSLAAGSTFTLTLPLKFAGSSVLPAHAPQPAAPLERHAPPTAVPGAGTASRLAPGTVPDDRDSLAPGKRLILVIEDDRSFAAILRDLAHEMGFQCVVTQSGTDGLIAAGEYQPSAVLLDIHLPDYSGLGVLDQLKRNPRTRHIPVHIASVADYRREALELGAVGYALKPTQREDLVDALRRLEIKLSQSLRRVLIVEDDTRQRESILQLLSHGDVQITAVATAQEALRELATTTFDCVVLDFNLPDLTGYDLLEKMAEQDEVSFPPVIVYTGRLLSRDEEQRLRRFSKSIIIKDARSPERLLDEVTLFLHQVEDKLPAEQQQMLKAARHRDRSLEGRRILVVEDDVRNVFALASVLEPKGAKVDIARNGREALDALDRSGKAPAAAVDMVLMDIMMPEMDGLTAMREIRKRAQWKKLPIIALTAKAMKDDQEKCLAAGASDYIAKPLDVEKLLSLVRVWMPK